MKAKILRAVSITQAFMLIIGMCIFTLPMKADAASLGVTPSTQYQSSVYYQRACAAYSSYSDPVTRFVQVALSQAGYRGGTYSSDWAGNGGGGQFTEYGRFMGADNDNWCASFVSWCAAAAGIPTNVIPRYTGAGDWRKWPGNGTLTPIWANNFTTYVDYKPQVGDLCLYMPYHDVAGCGKHYNAQSPTSHVVIVAWVSDTKNADGSYTFTTIERGSPTDGNVVASNTLTTKTTRGSAGTCSCGLQTPAGQYSYTVQSFYRPNWSLMGPTYTAGDVYENIKWTIDTDGVLNITGTGEMPAGYTPWIDNSDFRDQVKAVVIGEGITGVSDNAFRFVLRIKTVTLPSTLKKIGSMAFAGCNNLQTVNLPAGLEEIGKQAFWGTSSIGALQIPSNVKVIGDYAFYSCNGITNVTLSSKLTYIGKGAFEECENLKNVTIEEGVSKIPEYIFYRCTALTSITIPSTVTSIERNAFNGCTSLTDVFISASESAWENGVTVENSAFPDGVTFTFKYPELDFRVEKIEGNEVVLGWNHTGGVLYSVKIYKENGQKLKSYILTEEDVIDGKLEITATLESGKYRAGITVDSQASTHDAEVMFEVENMDSKNYQVTDLSGEVKEGRFYAEVEVVNLTDREEADSVIIAVYKDGEMLDYVYMKMDLPKDETVTFGGMLEGAEGAKLKAFVWDSIKGMKSLSNVVEK